MKKTLFLFTELFPFGVHSEQAFLQNEINYLCSKFDKVIIIPSNITGEQSNFGDFEIDISYVRLYNRKNAFYRFWNVLKSKSFYEELFSRRISFWNVKKLKRLCVFIDRMELTKYWLNKYIKNNNIVHHKLLIYTFWFNEKTLASLLFAGRNHNITVASRAHGHDIYENNPYFGGYLPRQKTMLEQIKRLYLVSQPAVTYLSIKFPHCSSKLHKFYLGVKKAGKIAQPSTDNVLRVVSCSYVLDRKRVDYILKGIVAYTNKYNQQVFWTHFGSGPLLDRIKKMAHKLKNDKFHFDFKGLTKNDEILHYYRNQPVDLFILTTAVEGGVPVAFQEAQAHGIPVIGTNVGGVPEIVNDKVGVLLNETPSDTEIADSFHYIISNKERFVNMRKNSVENWNILFNEEKNCKSFAKELYSLVE